MLINGAGATFPQVIYTKWFDQYQKVDPSVSFNYQGIGSGGGQKQILAETVDFGDSQIKLDGPTLAGIFLGTITKWNDPAIASQNADVKLPDEDIVVVHRSDG